MYDDQQPAVLQTNLFDSWKSQVETMKKVRKQNVEYEFQAIGLEMEKEWGKKVSKKIWPMFYKYELLKIRNAWFTYQKQKKVRTINYFFGILNKL